MLVRRSSTGICVGQVRGDAWGIIAGARTRSCVFVETQSFQKSYEQIESVLL